uniref:Chitin-binding type-2 domain-containing protein n=1 Tax=Anopheles farauti TaxID=69004 RepID=A0A182QXD9_9DIPT
MKYLIAIVVAACVVATSGQVVSERYPVVTYNTPLKNARTPLPELEDRFITLERCDNRSICLSSYDHQIQIINDDRFCQGYVELETVQSPICLNGVVHCENNRITGGCFVSVSAANADRVACDVVYQSCERHTPVSPQGPTSTKPTTPQPIDEDKRFVTLERCGNQSVCMSTDDFTRERYEQRNEICKGYVEKETIQSPTCLNAVVHCENHKYVGGCFVDVTQSSAVKMACDYVYKKCEVFTPSFKVVTSTEAPPVVENRFVPVEHCDNQTVCLFADDWETSNAMCEELDLPMDDPKIIPSPTCLNGAILCENNSIKARYFHPVTNADIAAFQCDIAVEILYESLYSTTITVTEVPTTTSTSSMTSTTSETTTSPWITMSTPTTVLSTTTSTSSPKVGDSCSRTNARAPNADNCTSFLECTNGAFAEQECPEYYVYYEPFQMCMPGDSEKCSLLKM